MYNVIKCDKNQITFEHFSLLLVLIFKISYFLFQCHFLFSRKWNGETRYIPNIRMKKVVKPTEVPESVSDSQVCEERQNLKQSLKSETSVSNREDDIKNCVVSSGETKSVSDMQTD